MNLPVLRPYQERDLQEIRTAFKSHRSVLLVQPTGAGKGTLASFIVASATSRGKRIMFLVNRRTLCLDMSKRLDKLGVEHGIIMSDNKKRAPWLPVQVASIDTLRRRDVMPEADILIVDEAHFAVSTSWGLVMDRYEKAKILAMTATPIRLDGKGLGNICTYMVMGPSVQELIDCEYLVPSRVFAPPGPDVSGVKQTAGDFNQKALSDACDKTRIIGDIVKHWKLHASERKTVIFGVDQKHATHIAEQFRVAGINMAYVDANTPDEEREKIWEDLDNGRLPGVSSCQVISYGFDHPIVSCVVLARPTASLSLHLQQVGRGLRPHPGKNDLLVLDHAANHSRHGFAEDFRAWNLDGDAVAGSSKDDGPSLSVSMCRACYFTFKSGPSACPACSAPIQIKHRQVQQEDGDLIEKHRKEQKEKALDEWRSRLTPEYKASKLDEWKRTAREKGYSRGWPYSTYERVFKEKVPAKQPVPPPPDVKAALNNWEQF